MLRPSQIVWQAAGRLPQSGATAGLCCLCGAESTGVPFRQWVKDAFTNYDMLQAGTIACHACQFCALDDCPPLTALTGKDKAQRMRNYSHIVTAAGEWLPLSKGQKRRVWLETCMTPAPQVVCIATSGQKHLLFRARPGWWQFEELGLVPDRQRTAMLVGLIACLIQCGFSKAEIETGQYRQDRLMAAWTAMQPYEQALKPHRGSPYTALALFLAQKPDEEEESDDGRDVLRPGKATPGPDLARDTEQLQEPVPPHDLATIRGQSPERSVHEQSEHHGQLTLF